MIQAFSIPRRLIFAALSTACLAAPLVGEPEAKAPETYTFAQLADPQLLFKQKDDRNWKRTVELVNQLSPDFAIVCGDLIQAKNNPEKWQNPEERKRIESLAKMYLDGAKKLKVPLYNVAGNHDVSIKPTPDTLAFYRKHFGEPWYHFEHKGSLFVVLESNLIRDSSGAPEEAGKQWAWFIETLEKAATQTHHHRFAFMHHPMCLKAVDEKDGYFNIPQVKRAQMLALLKKADFTAVMCGHYHQNAEVRDGELELITTASCGAPLGKDPLGFRVVTVHPDRIEHRYYSFEELAKPLK